MGRTYKAILCGDRIEWIDPPPDRKEPIPISITLQEYVPSCHDRGEVMAETLEVIAREGGLSTISDPNAWQRQVRQDRPIPGREHEC